MGTDGADGVEEAEAYGSAGDVRGLLRAMESTDPDVREEAMDWLATATYSDDDLAVATAGAVPELARLALEGPGHRVDLLTYPQGEAVDVPGLVHRRSLRLPVGRVKAGPSLAKLLLDLLGRAAVGLEGKVVHAGPSSEFPLDGDKAAAVVRPLPWLAAHAVNRPPWLNGAVDDPRSGTSPRRGLLATKRTSRRSMLVDSAHAVAPSRRSIQCSSGSAWRSAHESSDSHLESSFGSQLGSFRLRHTSIAYTG